MLNNTVLARIEAPSKEELRLPNPGAIPRHPGHNWDDPANRSNHHRTQVLNSELLGKKYGLMSTGTVDRSVALPNVSTGPAARLHGSIQNRVTDNVPLKEKPGLDSLLLSSNRYDLSGRKLSFKAWFTERVPESPIEKIRTRFVTISFFLEDETVAIFEPTIPSSGMNGGHLLRRTRCPLTETDASRRAPLPTDKSRFRDLAQISEKHITILDFNVDRPLIIFGTEYYLHECDGFSRELLTVLGVDVPEDTQPPTDVGFSSYRKKMTGFKATLPNSARLDPMRSGKNSKLSRQKIENCGVVIRFYAVWDEETTTTNNEHREHKFEFHYFLEDNTISLRERESQATGGEIIARHFLKRTKLPKSGDASDVVAQAAATTDPNEQFDFYGPLDFSIGARVNAFGRKLILVDADDATRKYYSERIGMDLAEPIIISTVKPKPPQTVKAASTELALLTREPPKPKSSLILKYELTLQNAETADDSLRRFVLTYYACDGEIAIGELVQRNSGFAGGRVLKKCALMKSDGSGGRVTSDDLIVGSTLKVYGRTFKIVRLSDRAEAFANSTQDASTMSDNNQQQNNQSVSSQRLKQLVKTFRDHVMGRYVTLAEAFRVFDQDADGKLTEFELRMFLAKHDISRSEAEAVALINAFTSPDHCQNGEISYADFVKGCTFGVPTNKSVSAEDIAASTARCREQANKQVNFVANRALLNRLRDRLEVRYMNVAEMFRAMSTMPRKWPAMIPAEDYAREGVRATLNALTNAEKDCVVTPVQFRRVLVERLGMNVSATEMAVLLKIFYPDLPESEYNSAEDVDARPPRAMRLEDMQRILTSNLRL